MAPKRRRKLFEAVTRGDARRVARLLDRGVSPNARNREGSTALYRAAVNGDTWVVGTLLVGRADPNLESGGEGDGTPLCAAACWGHRRVVDALLAAGADPNLPEADGSTPLMWAASGGWFECAVSILDAGGDASLADEHGWTPLHAAAERGSLRLVRLLIERGASAAVADAEGRTPAAVAQAWLGKDVEAELRRELAELAPDGGTVEARHTVLVQLTHPDGGGLGREIECGHAEIAALLASA